MEEQCVRERTIAKTQEGRLTEQLLFIGLVIIPYRRRLGGMKISASAGQTTDRLTGLKGTKEKQGD